MLTSARDRVADVAERTSISTHKLITVLSSRLKGGNGNRKGEGRERWRVIVPETLHLSRLHFAFRPNGELLCTFLFF